jgi:hypothetical protein
VDPATKTLLLIVVGAHLRAERHDRPLARRLREEIRAWTDAFELGDDRLEPLICTDLWYLNQPELMLRPTIAMGDPECNAATALLANRLPTVLVVDESLRIHLDPEFVELKACLWGLNPSAMASGLALFTERYLDPFLRAAHDLPESPE